MQLLRQRALVLAIAGAGCWVMPGCGPGNRLATYPAKIEVAFTDGTLLTGGHVTLQSEDHRVSGTGILDANGTCHIGTYVPGDGAVAGVHRVAVIPPRPAGHPDSVATVDVIDRRFLNPGTSGLTVDVKAGDNNEFHLQVTRPAR